MQISEPERTKTRSNVHSVRSPFDSWSRECYARYLMELFFKKAQEYLRFEHQLRKARRPAYSMRAFSRDLGVSPSSLNDFLKGRVGMSEERIEAIAEALQWSPLRKEHFRDLILAQFDRDKGVRQSAAVRVKIRLNEDSCNYSLEAFKVISDWYHLAILELCALKDHLTPKIIATELNLKTADIEMAVQRLIRLRLLKKTKSGLKPEADTSHFGDDGQAEAIKTFHSQMMELAHTALQKNEGPLHESQSMIFSVKTNDVEKMNVEIRRATLEIVHRYAQVENPNCIQALSLQIFPVWKPSQGSVS